jgi:hypothetical protein
VQSTPMCLTLLVKLLFVEDKMHHLFPVSLVVLTGYLAPTHEAASTLCLVIALGTWVVSMASVFQSSETVEVITDEHGNVIKL